VPRENDHYDRSPRREEVRGEILRGERFFMERVFVEIEASWRDFSVERSAPRREASRRDSLHGENSQGEMIFKEIMSLWIASSRRDSLRGEPGQLMQSRLTHISIYKLLIKLVYFLQQFTYTFVQSG
jgi:hypothetical protein